MGVRDNFSSFLEASIFSHFLCDSASLVLDAPPLLYNVIAEKELNTAKIQALRELGYTKIDERNASEVLDKIAEIMAQKF